MERRDSRGGRNMGDNAHTILDYASHGNDGDAPIRAPPKQMLLKTAIMLTRP